MSYIEIRNLTVQYMKVNEDGSEVPGKTVLDDLSLEIEKGSFVSVVGMNGSGKSTLAKCLNGLILPTKGDVIVDGMNTKDEDHLWDIRSRVGMVFQNPDNQIVSSIVEDDVAFGPENLGIEPAEIRRRVDYALKQVGMYDQRLKGAHMLSGGQKQRIAIAGAVAMRPECIIFDEPTAMLDPKGREKIMSIIRELNADGITAILITHFMSEAVETDRVIVMNAGRILCDRTPAQLFSDTEMIERAGLELPPFIELREKAGLPSDITDLEEMAAYLQLYVNKSKKSKICI